MGLEVATFISDLNANNPVGATDPVAQGDDHLRLLKSVLKNTFPNLNGAVTLTPAQINGVLGAAMLAANDQAFTGSVNRFQNAAGGRIALIDSDQAAGQKIFIVTSNAGSLRISPATDGLSVVENAITISSNTASEVTNITATADNINLTASAAIAIAAPSLTLAGVNFTDVARKSITQTFTAQQTIHVAGQNLTLKGTAVGAADTVYQAWLDNAGTRHGYVGKDNPTNTDFAIVNSVTAGKIRIATTGSGPINLESVGVRITDNTQSATQPALRIGLFATTSQVAMFSLCRAGNVIQILRNDTNAVEGFVSVGTSDVAIGSYTAHPVRLYVGNVNAVTVGTDGGITTPCTNASEFGFKGIPPNFNAGTGHPSFALNAAHNGTCIAIAAGANISINLNASTPIPVGTVVQLVGWAGSGAFLVSPQAGVTLYWVGTDFVLGTRTLSGGLAKCVLTKMQTDTWTIEGVGIS